MPMNRRALASALLGLALPAGAAPDRVRVVSTTDRAAAQPLIDDFERAHPGQRVQYEQLGSVELYERFLADEARSADVLWSSAMDLQIKLVNDGHAERYESPQAAGLPRWAVWKHEAYGTTHEPVGFAYHRLLLEPQAVPRTHVALAALLQSDVARFRGRVGSYDIEQAGLGFLIAAHDAMVWPKVWELMQTLGQCQVQLYAESRRMLEDLAAGRTLIAYNVLGSYAEAFAREHPEIEVVYPADYTLVVSRVAFIARHAANPAGARLWLDHLLSPRGQQLLADAGTLYAVREDAATERSAAAVGRRLGGAARPIALGPGLLAHLDQSKRRAFLKRWNAAVRPR